jgi:lipid-A-disaccharide synthase-like uncharacterized protein
MEKNMSTTLIYATGFLAQLLFSARMLLQWLKSEAVGKVVSPAFFWWFSIGGALLMITYGILREDVVIIVGQLLLYYIYIRNLMLKRVWPKSIPGFTHFMISAPFLIIAVFKRLGISGIAPILKNDAIPLPLLIWGGMSTAVFSFRFFYQWVSSERSDNSVFPLGFWIISIIGCVMLLIYGILRSDPVLVLGQSFSTIIYGRNIILLKRGNQNQRGSI